MCKKAAEVPKTSCSATIYDHCDIMLGKVRDYVPWYGMVRVLNILEGVSGDNDDGYPGSRPKQCTAASPRRPTSGQKANFRLVRFFPAGDFSWLAPKDISKLQQHEIEAYINEPLKKSDDLLTSYKFALDPLEWDKHKAEQAEAAASGGVVDEVDQLDSENEKPKKRKRDSEDGASARKCKTSTAGDTKKKALPKGRKVGKKKENVESEDDGEADEDVGTSKKGTSHPQRRKLREIKKSTMRGKFFLGDVANDPEALKVREWQHRLQKTFLSNEGGPKEEHMPEMDKLFHTVKAYQPITIRYLTVTTR
ncbi:uncharacterized protein ARMOST_14165 [Armillaria ostoyae]|uniref:PWWP domain-containing protein n=1 Tax=Armillaria ostoyae TaxID=47428 RepID=A0A284RPT2_ARMOS|nr:uncharacterized protein ARMOST_14165 [Armillaria ostoyae]